MVTRRADSELDLHGSLLPSCPSALILRSGDSIVAWWHTKDGGTGIQHLDGEQWERYRID